MFHFIVPLEDLSFVLKDKTRSCEHYQRHCAQVKAHGIKSSFSAQKKTKRQRFAKSVFFHGLDLFFFYLEFEDIENWGKSLLMHDGCIMGQARDNGGLYIIARMIHHLKQKENKKNGWISFSQTWDQSISSFLHL